MRFEHHNMKRINLPTWLTIGRIGITPVIVLLLYFPNKATCLSAVILYLLASASDYFDGRLARRTKQVTSFGKFLDPLADKVLNCSILIMLAHWQWVYAWVVIMIVCRELMVTGLRAIAADEGHVMAADGLGKLKTVCQGIAIVPLMLHFTWFGWDLRLFGEIVLYVALALTVFSGAHYFYAFYKHWRVDIRQGAGPAPAQNPERERDAGGQ
jgi:CDP-diacylglycerol--glycerol-3-phosphate 3-phosphatidyltransferase